MRSKMLAGVLLGAALLGACSNADKTGASSSPAPNTRPSSTGKLTILSPTPGQVVTGTSFTVKVELEGATLIKEATRDVRPDTGHVHILLDGKTVTLLAGLEYELTNLTPGSHLLQAEFAAADHGSFNPRVITTVTFTVQQ